MSDLEQVTEAPVVRPCFCPICKQYGDIIGPQNADTDRWWHRRPQPEGPDAFCGPFERVMCRADDRCLERDGHAGPCR